MPVDYHCHTARCGHAQGTVEEYLRRARALGLEEVGFADHLPQYFLPPGRRDPGLAMAEEELADYVAEVLAAAAAGPGPAVRLGCEADYVPGREADLAAFLRAHPFDYVLGSVHYLDGWGFDNPAHRNGYATRDRGELIVTYFRLVQRAATSGLFDVLAHPDLIKKFGPRLPPGLTSLYEETVRAIKKADVCVEVNTAGLRHPVQEIYPTEEFLRLCRAHRVPVCLGSDAHRPADVGAGLEQAVALLREVGYREIALFRGRRRILREL